MYAVIFRAKVSRLDEHYSEMAKQMRDRATNLYGCTEFTCVTEGREEIAISYWPDLDKIREWKEDSEHLAAQALGQSTWYKSYKIEIVEIVREYSSQA